MRPSKETVKKEAIKLQGAVREKALEYLLVAFGLVAGLAWNEAIKSLIDSIFPSTAGGGIAAKFVYAFVATLIVVAVSVYLVKLTKKEYGDDGL